MKELSVGAKAAWQIAAMEAGASKHQLIESEHIFTGICSLEKIFSMSPEESGFSEQELRSFQEEFAILQELMKDFGLDMTQLRRRMRKQLGIGHYSQEDKIMHRSDSCKEMFDLADSFVSSDDNITALHLLAAIWEQPLRQRVLAYIARKYNKELVKDGGVEDGRAKVKNNLSYLDRFGRDLTSLARDGKLDPFIGRRKELLQLIQTLAKSTKNNPVLVGEAGVGKTAIVEALAVRAVQGKDPQVLAGKRIIELSLGVLVSGTKYRGEFEERLTKIIEEVIAKPDIIIFIDEIHNLVGAGQGSGSMDAANIMKPALARGDFKCIGATTLGEYRRYVEADPALERRFEKVFVNEPSRDEAIEILKGIRPKWEKHFGKKITDKALESAVDLSIRFDADHHLPDKAVDLVDKAGARVQVPFLSMVQKQAAESSHGDAESVTEDVIAAVLAAKIGIPLEIIKGQLKGISDSRLPGLNSFLKATIIGQDEAIDRISARLMMAHAGMGRKNGPMAVFLFLGPTGVGKTMTAKCLSEFLFGSEGNLIRLDMSEFKEEHSISKLIGSPPGYVGYKDEGQLTSRLRSKPYSIVLLDEAEKAHPSVFDLFLQLFDEGRINDAKGRTIDAKNAIFIMTSNLLQTEQKKAKIGFLEQKDEEENSKPDSEMLKYFRPEFLNRIDEQIVFKPLSEDVVRQILISMLGEIVAAVQKRYNVVLRFSADAEVFLGEKGYSPEYGVRELRRTVEKYVQMPLSNLMLSGKLKEHLSWNAALQNQGIQFVPVDTDEK